MAKSRSRRWRLAAGLAGIGLALLALAAARVQWTTSPGGSAEQSFDFEAMSLKVEDVRFRSTDGLALTGWLLPGEPSRSPILLCHDLGQSKADLVDLAIELNGAGFPLLLFDFRGHGGSQAARSTLGLFEKRDILGAVDFLSERKAGPARFGIYAVGMGAHAAVLAAADRRSLSVLVLDGLYPDASYPLVRRFWEGWPTGVEHLGAVPKVAFALMNGVSADAHRASDMLSGLLGRDILLLAPAGDPTLVAELRRMYGQIPEQREVDGNLEVLPATQSVGLFGKDVERHRERVLEFFRTRLVR